MLGKQRQNNDVLTKRIVDALESDIFLVLGDHRGGHKGGHDGDGDLEDSFEVSTGPRVYSTVHSYPPKIHPELTST